MKKPFFFLVLLSLLTFAQERSEALIIQGNIFTVSYNESYEQPNWIIYCVRDVPKNVDWKGYNFRKDALVWTSNNADYKNNIWDKGHLAPAAAFSDSEDNLKATFSFLNCTLQHHRLNRKEWAPSRTTSTWLGRSVWWYECRSRCSFWIKPSRFTHGSTCTFELYQTDSISWRYH